VRRLIVAFIVLAVLGAVSYVAYRMLIGPSEGTVAGIIPDNTVQPAAAPELEQFEGTYLTFAYPGNYVVRPPSSDDTHNLETHTFVASGMMHKILTVTVTSLPSGKLEDDTSYYMRSLHPETYQLKPEVIQGEKVVVAVDAKDSQEAAFWVHKSANGVNLLTFTVSSVTVGSAATAQEYQKMLESVRWR